MGKGRKGCVGRMDQEGEYEGGLQGRGSGETGGGEM